ncbi:LysR substrate-binding domain-containing protein [Bartonella sp. DGB2]|uniref:LysR substrate-binding domain-containing protein n=1 Tax=Bartonella sp. DGB2 TaxID=3388426 RepID=UPI00398FDFAA
MMTLRQIRYFIAVAESGSIALAAQTILISQSSLTNAIQQLEDELGVCLFERHARGMKLTYHGNQFLRQSHIILSTIENAKLSLHPASRQLQGTLTLGVTSLVAGYYLADLMLRFRQVHPDVAIKVIEDERIFLEHLLINGEVDVGVMIISNLVDRWAVHTETLTHSPHRLWLPALHPLLEKPSISLSDIVAEDMIELEADEMQDFTRKIWTRARLVPKVTLRTASVEAVRSLVATGAGLSIQPDMTYRPWSLEGDIIEARPIADSTEPLDIGFAWRRGSPPNPLLEAFINIARNRMNEQRHI